MIYEIILEAKLESDSTWTKLDLPESELPSLEKSLFDMQDISLQKTEISKTFRLPAEFTANATFFGDFKDYNQQVFNPYDIWEARIVINGNTFMRGNLYFIGFDHLEHVYEVKIAGKIGSIKARLGDKNCSQLSEHQLSKFNHPYTIQSIKNSWTRELAFGNIIYPISDDGWGFGFYTDVSVVDPDDNASRDTGGESGVANGNKDVWTIDKSYYPIPFTSWRPGVRVATLARAILEDAGFNISENYLLHEEFKHIKDAYALLSYAETEDASAAYNKLSGVAYLQNIGAIPPFVPGGTNLPFATVVNAINLSIVSGKIQFPNFDSQTLISNAPSLVITGVSGGNIPTGNLTVNDSLGNSVNFASTDLDWTNIGGNTYRAELNFSLDESITANHQYSLTAFNYFNQDITFSGGMYVNGTNTTISITRNIVNALSGVSQLEFVSSFMKHFGLYFDYDKINDILNIVTYSQLIGSGSDKDWTEKIEYIKQFRNDSLTDKIPSVYKYKYKDFDSYINELAKSKFGDNMGSLKINVELQTMLPNIEIKNIFSPCPIVSNETTEWVMMRNFKDVTKPKLSDNKGFNMFMYNGTYNLSGNFVDDRGNTRSKLFYVQDEFGNATQESVWPIISRMTDSGRDILIRYDGHLEVNRPDVITDTFKMAHYARLTEWFGLSYTVGGDAIIRADALRRARLVRCSIYLTHEEYENISFGDKITITNSHGTADFRILSVKNFNIIGDSTCTLELIRISWPTLNESSKSSSEGTIYLHYDPKNGHFLIDGQTSNVGSGQIIIPDWETGAPLTAPVPIERIQTPGGEFSIDAGTKVLKYNTGGASVTYNRVIMS